MRAELRLFAAELLQQRRQAGIEEPDLEQDEEGLAQRILDGAAPPKPGAPVQLGLFAARSAVEEELARLDLDRLSPLEALLKLRELRARL